ncbi:MAG: HAMP domain-containing histidine kinase [Proteobacteria bacterium]|nr:HAMP domain-containing histidine kinase [Pseudomonadota bacterium]MBU1641204.1 HAMP domain-containing histidine kinase [Pseudomonadota bacterium]
MSLRSLLDCRHTLAFRLTLWYAFFFVVSALVTFQVFFVMTSSYNRAITDNELVLEYQEFAALFSSGGLDPLREAIKHEVKVEGADRFFFRLVGPAGEEMLVTEKASWQALFPTGDEVVEAWPASGYVIYPVAHGGYRHGAHVLYGKMGPDISCQIVISRVKGERFLDTLRHVFGMVVFIAVVLSAATGLFMARRALAGVKEITLAAQEIAGGALDRRVANMAGGREIAELADTFNAMLDRISLLIKGMGEMTDNIAHDLKSPVTRMRVMAEMALVDDRDAADRQDLAADIVEQCDMLLEMINTMLLISEAEAGATSFQKDRVDMAGVVEDACELFMPLAEDKKITLEMSLAGPCAVAGNLNLLQRMVANLLDNALKYSPAGTIVSLALTCGQGRMALSFHDSGMGIAEKDIAHIFERFYRCDQSRNLPGSGLGLSLARAIVISHGGDIKVESTPGQGSVFTVTLPLLASTPV